MKNNLMVKEAVYIYRKIKFEKMKILWDRVIYITVRRKNNIKSLKQKNYSIKTPVEIILGKDGNIINRDDIIQMKNKDKKLHCS